MPRTVPMNPDRKLKSPKMGLEWLEALKLNPITG
jgi:hypothetical protein